MTTIKSQKEIRETLMARLIDVLEHAKDEHSRPLFEALKEFSAGYKHRHTPLVDHFLGALEDGLCTHFISEEMEREAETNLSMRNDIIVDPK